MEKQLLSSLLKLYTQTFTFLIYMRCDLVQKIEKRNNNGGMPT